MAAGSPRPGPPIHAPTSAGIPNAPNLSGQLEASLALNCRGKHKLAFHIKHSQNEPGPRRAGTAKQELLNDVVERCRGVVVRT